MKKFFALFAAMFLALVAFGGPAFATGGNVVDGKPVTVCHATGSAKNPYVKLTNVPVVQFFGEDGHAAHEGDIWAAFTYYEKVNGEWVERHQAAQGNTDLLQYDKCKANDQKIAAPAVSVDDPCGTGHDAVTPAVSDKYTTTVTKNGNAYTVVATATGSNEFNPAQSTGWTLSEDNTVATKTFNLSDEDCGLPETGSATTNVVGGVLVLGLLAAGTVLLLRRRSA